MDDGRACVRNVPVWQPWAAIALFAFLLNFVWEMLQVPFYGGLDEAAHWDATLVCLRASGGDALIGLAAYAVVAWPSGRLWLAHSTLPRLGAFVGAGLLITIVIEWVSVHVLHRWAYAEGVPVVAGIGLPPLLQWLLLPPAFLWLTWRHLGRPGGNIKAS